MGFCLSVQYVTEVGDICDESQSDRSCTCDILYSE